MSRKDADEMANSVDPDQIAPLIWVYTAKAYLSENLGSIRQFKHLKLLKEVISKFFLFNLNSEIIFRK